MATANQPVSSATPAPLASMPLPAPISNGAIPAEPARNVHLDMPPANVASPTIAPLNNGHHHHAGMSDSQPAPMPRQTAKKPNPKNRKPPDMNDFSKQVMGRINQLEVDSAAEKEQEAEIEREVRKAKRELNNQTHKMNDMEKIDLVTKRWAELFANMKRLERENIKNKKRADQLQKEKDTSRTEASKQTGLKEKLEKLCRELQKENNKLKNEQRTLKDAHDKLKKDGDNRFDMVLKALDGHQEDKDNPRKQVLNTKVEDLFKNRFKSLIDQYELRELHFHSLMRTKEIEVQYNMALVEQQRKQAESEALRARQLHSQVQTFSKTETELRTQLNVYVERFKQVEETLNNSNDLFLTFRKEMEDLSKQKSRLKKENEVLRRKSEVMNQNTLQMVDERTKHLKDLDSMRKKSEKLTSIIKQMQQQGRGIPPGMQGTIDDGVEGGNEGYEGDGHAEGDESEYEYEDGEEEEEEEDDGEHHGSDGEFDDDTEEENYEPGIHPVANVAPAPPTYGPDRPPVPSPAAAPMREIITTANGHL